MKKRKCIRCQKHFIVGSGKDQYLRVLQQVRDHYSHKHKSDADYEDNLARMNRDIRCQGEMSVEDAVGTTAAALAFEPKGTPDA